MRRSTWAKVGLVTLVSCSAHAALIPIFPDAVETAQISGGTVRVHFASGEPARSDQTEKTEKQSEVRPHKVLKDPEPVKSKVKKSKPLPTKMLNDAPIRKVQEHKPVPEKKAEALIPEPQPAPKQEPQDMSEHESILPKSAVDTDAVFGESAPKEQMQKDNDKALSGSLNDPSSKHPLGEKPGKLDSLSAASKIESNVPTAKQQGNSQRTNYAGEVMRHLSRIPRPRASGPGSALIRFTITRAGDLSDVAIEKSSGSGRFDRDAIKVVKKAAPYPKPPPGADLSMVVEIKGR